MLRHRTYVVRVLAIIVSVFLVAVSAGCGTQPQASTGAQSTLPPTPTATPLLLDLDSTAGVAQVIAGNSSVGGMGDRIDSQALDIPALVFYLSGHGGPVFTELDHWVVTTRDTSGRRVGVFDFHYVRSQHVLRFGGAGVITPGDPHSASAFPWLTSATAVERLHKLRGLAPAAGVAPRMIYFSIDDRWRDPGSPISQWYGGGESAMDPMWQIQATDGVTYYVGQDLKVYVYADLPIEPAYK